MAFLFIYLLTDSKKIASAVQRHKHNYTLITPKALSKIESNRLFLRYKYMVQARYSGARSQNDYCMDRT